MIAKREYFPHIFRGAIIRIGFETKRLQNEMLLLVIGLTDVGHDIVLKGIEMPRCRHFRIKLAKEPAAIFRGLA